MVHVEELVDLLSILRLTQDTDRLPGRLVILAVVPLDEKERLRAVRPINAARRFLAASLSQKLTLVTSTRLVRSAHDGLFEEAFAEVVGVFLAHMLVDGDLKFVLRQQ